MKKKINCSPNLTQTIRISSRKDFIEIINDIASEVVDTIVPLDELIDKIGFFISDRFEVDVLHADSSSGVPGRLLVNGQYDQEKDQEGKVGIQILLISYPSDKTFLWDEEEFAIFATNLADSLVHELSHLKQARTRNFKIFEFDKEFEEDKKAAQFYLGSPDEIDAYSRNIADDMLEIDNMNSYLKNPKLITPQESSNFWVYMNTFDYDFSNPVLRKLIKKIYKLVKHRNQKM